jgi:hypothetical protein
VSFDEDDLLVRAIGEVGGLVGVGGRLGAETGARRLRKDVLEIDLVTRMSPQQAADRARQVLGQHGVVLRSECPGGDSVTRVIGIMGSGAANLNPAVVTVIVHASEWGSRLVIRGAAKEGLIKQRAGAKAAKRVAAGIAPDVVDPRPG